jgi:hypothetical protein
VNDKILSSGTSRSRPALPLEGESAQKRNLLIFVTANLVSPGGSPKKQSLKSLRPTPSFQNPTIVTPASAEPRTRSGAK